MLLLCVGWCLPLPIPSSKKCTTYPKTHKLPCLKTHNPHATLRKNSMENSQPAHTTLPQNTPVKQCCLLSRLSDGSVAHALTPTRMLRAVTALCARPGAWPTMPSWLAQQWLQRQGQPEWIVAIRLTLLHCQQLDLLLPGRWLPPPMRRSLGRGLMLSMGHLLWGVVRPSTKGRLPNWGAIM
jgi:hypothetical protein